MNFIKTILHSLLLFISNIINTLKSILFPKQNLKQINKDLSVFFEDIETEEMTGKEVNVEGFLGIYNEDELQKELINYTFGKESIHCGKSFEQILSEKGFQDIKIVFDTEDFYIHRLQIYNEIVDMQHLLIQLFIRCDNIVSLETNKQHSNHTFSDELSQGVEFTRKYFREHFHNKGNLNVTNVEWLRIQDYRQQCENKILLPSQLHSGLGLTREVHLCVQHFSKKQQRDGIINTPEQWHNACHYLKMNPPFQFINPVYEGIFLSINDAIKNDIEEKGFVEVVWAITSQCLRRKDNGEKIEWLKLEQMSPLSDEMNQYFNSKEYKEMVKNNYHPENIYIDWDKYGPCGLNQ